MQASFDEATALRDDGIATLDLDRRGFLSLMAASTALAGLQGCRRPDIEILPYARMPEVVTPGMPLFYATSVFRARWCSPRAGRDA